MGQTLVHLKLIDFHLGIQLSPDSSQIYTGFDASAPRLHCFWDSFSSGIWASTLAHANRDRLVDLQQFAS